MLFNFNLFLFRSDTPVFASKFRKYSAEDVVNILFDKTKYQGYICQQQFLGVQESKVIIVDTVGKMMASILAG